MSVGVPRTGRPPHIREGEGYFTCYGLRYGKAYKVDYVKLGI